MVEPLEIKRYIGLNWIVKLTNERTVETVSSQAFEAFRKRINKKFIPLYEDANVIEKPTSRRAKQMQLKLSLIHI